MTTTTDRQLDMEIPMSVNVALQDLTPPRRKLTPLHLWDRITGKAERDAWSEGESLGFHRGLADAAAYCERYGARHHDIRRAALEVCAEHIRAVIPGMK
jgi:hypothetical protein